MAQTRLSAAVKDHADADHPDTLLAIVNLASGWSEAGQHDKAEPLYRRVSEAYTRLLGPHRPRTLHSIANLALTLLSLGSKSSSKLEEAERICRDLLPMLRRVLGETHPVALTTASKLAAVLEGCGRHAEAEILLAAALNALRSCTKTGPSHSRTLVAAQDLAQNLAEQGKLDEASILADDTLTKMRETLGPTHKTTERMALLKEWIDGVDR